MWDSASFVVGIMIGLIVMLLLVWALYTTRTFVFEVCPTSSRVCRFADYFNAPGLALADGANFDEILFLREGQLYYKRVPKASGCVPLPATQTIRLRYPQYCSFTTAEGRTVEGRQVQPGAPVYAATMDGQTIDVMSGGDCSVERSTPAILVSGTPLLKWDVASLNEQVSSDYRN